MKKKKITLKVFAASVLLAALTLISANPASAQQAARPNPTGDGVAAAGYVSGLFSLLPGQSVRVSAVNMGKKAIPVEFVFIPVTDQGKAAVPILCNAAPAPGDAMIEKFAHPGGVNRMLMYVQIRVEKADDLKGLAPSLEVFDEQSAPGGGPHFFLSGSDFAEIRPIWVPA